MIVYANQLYKPLRHRYGLSSGIPTTDVTPPIGYFDRSFPNTAARDQDANLMVKRSWDIALAPLRQVPMNLFIMWMTGNSISIFPIMMIIMMFMRPLQAIFSMQASEFPFSSFWGHLHFSRSFPPRWDLHL